MDNNIEPRRARTQSTCGTEQIVTLKKSGIWQFYHEDRWHVGMNSHNHRENTEADGMPTRDLYVVE